MERILCFGDREWDDIELITVSLLAYFNTTECVIEGECRGADRLSKIAAQSIGFNILSFPADWTKYGKAAGPIRNQQMLDEGKPTLGLCFHDNLQESRGSKDMLIRLLKAGIPVRHISHSGSITIKEFYGAK